LGINLILVFFIVLAGCFTQSLTGFGVALVTMAMLPPVLGLQIATPLVALVAIALEFLMLIRYRASLKFKSILGLLLSSLIAIPAGVLYFRRLDEEIALFLLGLVITLYALYALTGVPPAGVEAPGLGMAVRFAQRSAGRSL
jgi:uncharacterized protein